MNKVATVLLSGGIDSAACAHYLKAEGKIIRAVFVDYGQAAVDQEKSAAIALSRVLSIPIDVIAVHGPRSFGPGEVVGRNAFLILSALSLCNLESGFIALGIHSGTRYYDCSPSFHSLIDRVVAEYTDGLVRVAAPFLNWSKKKVTAYFGGAGLPFENTYSCESGTVPACGRCLSCRDREAIGC